MVFKLYKFLLNLCKLNVLLIIWKLIGIVSWENENDILSYIVHSEDSICDSCLHLLCVNFVFF